MNTQADARIPIVFGATPGPDDAALVEDGHDMPETGYAVRFTTPATTPGHAPNCACCTLRGPAADALSAMFQARARGAAPYFKRITILASPAGQSAIRDAITADRICAARFRVLDDV